jgi:dihydroorotase
MLIYLSYIMQWLVIKLEEKKYNFACTMQYLIKNGSVINEGKIEQLDILIDNNLISKIGKDISAASATVIDASNSYIIPGIIDDQVHFREPGLTHKANIYTKAKQQLPVALLHLWSNPIPNRQP